MNLDVMAVELPETFGDRLRGARNRAGLTQKEAAERCNMTQNLWTRFECCDQNPDAVYMKALAKAQKLWNRDGGCCQSGDCAAAIKRAREKFQRLDRIAAAVNTTAKHLLGEE